MNEEIPEEWKEFYAKYKQPHLEREAVKLWNFGQRVAEAPDLATLRRLLGEYFQYEAEKLREEFRKANEP